MKKIIQKINIPVLLLAGIFLPILTQAQWLSKASHFPVANRGVVEMVAVNSNVIWAIGYDAINPLSSPVNDFTRSTDGGNNWTAGKIDAFPDYYFIGIAPVSGTVCYGTIANIDNGNTKVVKTTDGGTTWTEQLNYDYGEAFGFFADIYFFNANDGLVFGDQSDGYFTIFTTSDGGNHWTRVSQANMPASLNTDEASYANSSEGISNTFWTVSTAGRIWKTTDKGLHWNAYQSLETEIDFSNLKMRDAQHGLWGVHGELYRTSDGGITWMEVEPSGTWFTDDLAYVPGTVSTYVSTGGHNFPGYGALHGIGSSYSLDDGNTWITIDTAVEHLCLAMLNPYSGVTGSLNQNASAKGIFKYNGSAFGYSCGNDLTSLCHKGNMICIGNASIESHLSHGDALGTCSSASTLLSNKSVAANEAIQTRSAYQLNNFPNPFSRSTTITYSIPQPGKVSLKIYDVIGRPIKTLVNGEVAAGTYNIQWKMNDEKGKAVPAGIYFLRIQAGNYSEIKKLLIIK
jgi:photosystem II stability/assembly factor-like uncharacterized protein